MSRIHEALKKAEQEEGCDPGRRGVGQLRDGTGQRSIGLSGGTTLDAASGDNRNSGDASILQSVQLDSLLARCPQMEWKPDLGIAAVEIEYKGHRYPTGHSGHERIQFDFSTR